MDSLYVYMMSVGEQIPSLKTEASKTILKSTRSRKENEMVQGPCAHLRQYETP
jgi:hypothetical protein